MKSVKNDVNILRKIAGKQRVFISIGSVICLIAALWGIKIFSAAERNTAAINALLERRATALNQKNLTQYLDCFSVDYHSGDKTYHDLQADAELWFSQFDSIQFSFDTIKIDRQKNMARVENQYRFVLTSSTGKPVNIANKELLEVRQDAAGWKITASLVTQ